MNLKDLEKAIIEKYKKFKQDLDIIVYNKSLYAYWFYDEEKFTYREL